MNYPLSQFKPAYTSAISLILLALILSCAAQGAVDNTSPGSFEMSCRMKAKEVAAETYRGCVVENRKAQIDQIKADYQAKLKSLKDEYDQELKKASGTSGSSTDPQQAPAPQTSRSEPKIELRKKQQTARATTHRTLPTKKRSVKESTVTTEDMTVQIRSTVQPTQDESTMDIPEPIPVENIQGPDSQI